MSRGLGDVYKRQVVDFPGALPSAALRALKVNHGALKGVRSGLFFRNPPITRIVLDLTGPQSYKISTTDHATVVKLAGAGVDEQSAGASTGAFIQSVGQSAGPSAGPSAGQSARLRDAALVGRSDVAHVSPARALAGAAPKGALELGDSAVSLKRYPDTNRNDPNWNASVAAVTPPTVPVQVTAPEQLSGPVQPPQPTVSVTYENGMLRILADKATLSQVLYEVHLRTQAEIAIPAGAEQERVVADLGPAPARDVLSQLLNGSAYNFIFVGEELSLQRVILTPRAGGF